jgi:hypothetical protein
MARNMGDVIARVRDVLQDKTSPYRFDDQFLLRHLDSAYLEARRLRPDLFAGRIGEAMAQLDGHPTTYGFPLPESYLPAFVSYAVGMADLVEEEFAADGRASALMQRFAQQLGRA